MSIFPMEFLQPRRINGLTILGPDWFATDQEGKPLSPIAVIFPKLLLVVTGRGIHAELVAMGEEFLRARLLETEKRDPTTEEEQEIYENVISLLVRDSTVLIRSYPDDMERVFAADELLQRLLPKERIQFTGVHITEVREPLRRRGENWRIAPPPRSAKEICQHISASRVHVKTGTTYFQNAQSGERFLTYGEFIKIRPLLRQAPREALFRLMEIDYLSRLVNDQGMPELSFFIPARKKLATNLLEDLIPVLEHADSRQDLERAEDLFDHFAMSFAEAAGDELSVDGEKHTTWQTTMFCRLYNLDEALVEERTLGLSPEFHLNVRWLPGAHLAESEVTFEARAEPRVRSLITYFLQSWPGIVSINIGRVESPLTERDRTGEEREVFLVVLGLPQGGEEIRLLRLMKWDVVHRLKQGFPLSQAVSDTLRYRDYVVGRLRATNALEIPILSYTAIELAEELHGVGQIPVFFFDRRYVAGLVSDKIPLRCYAKEGFVIRLARLLGVAAAASMVLGRASYRRGDLFFDDGDEVIQLNAEKLPERLVISETTGSFTNSTTPIGELLPQCLGHLAVHLKKARDGGISQENLRTAVEVFAEALRAEIVRMQSRLSDQAAGLGSLFDGQTAEPGSIRERWKNMMDRLAATDTRALQSAVFGSPHLADLVSP
jgi:hypothetical protein